MGSYHRNPHRTPRIIEGFNHGETKGLLDNTLTDGLVLSQFLKLNAVWTSTMIPLLALSQEPRLNPLSRFDRGRTTRLISLKPRPRSSACLRLQAAKSPSVLSRPDASPTPRSANSLQRSEPLTQNQSRSFVLDWDFWIDLGLVVLSGCVSFALLKLVECVVLTDAIIGGF